MNKNELLLALLAEGFTRSAWHGPNLQQSLKGVRAKQAAWRPARGRHNIWELALHSAYWKYAVRRRIEGGKRGSFVLKGSNFFTRPEKERPRKQPGAPISPFSRRNIAHWSRACRRVLKTNPSRKILRMLYGIAFHDIYHAGQIRLLRTLDGELKGLFVTALRRGGRRLPTGHVAKLQVTNWIRAGPAQVAD